MGLDFEETELRFCFEIFENKKMTLMRKKFG